MKKRFINTLINAAISLFAVIALHTLNLGGNHATYILLWFILFKLISE